MRSKLVSTFLQRVRQKNAVISTPEEAISYLIRRARLGLRGEQTTERVLDHFQRRRQVRTRDSVEGLGHDGALMPLGKSYDAGFKIVLDSSRSPGRKNFTNAHEICHSFFYEMVPEIKFHVHKEDAEEERLCDFGAAEILMPRAHLDRSCAERNICLQSLKDLATEYSVTPTAMFLRLRALRIWDGQYSEWYRMSNGSFVLQTIFGCQTASWTWDETMLLNVAWNTGESVFGNTTVSYIDDANIRRSLAITFEARRKGNAVVALWANGIRHPNIRNIRGQRDLFALLKVPGSPFQENVRNL